MSNDKLAALLDDLIERDPDAAERLIEKHLGRLALKKRLQAFKAEKQDNCQKCQTPRACEYHGCKAEKQAGPVAGQSNVAGKDIGLVVQSLLSAADAYAMRYVECDIPTGGLYRGITHDAKIKARDALRTELEGALSAALAAPPSESDKAGPVAEQASAVGAEIPGFSPMYLAPLDGTPVMLYMPTTGDKFAIGRWHGSPDSLHGNWGDDEGNYYVHQPAGFMALSNLERLVQPAFKPSVQSPATPSESDKEDAERWQELRRQHEGDAVYALTVFGPDDDEGLSPIGSIPGELDAAIDAIRAARAKKEQP